eukprot:CAMPEP_0170568452 /NCGR_PEP_ID=MMETSP0211-20121228/81211_1 /TAXON_ID=311385 /ORGANISM="Pseudokeronopsis sp., Strain OXSARD2" /LENGTH=185 /DNA_ID=CAMNT_0010890355 /DNA_START=1156 /DNA_END=1713 /DNA_ORIENTATION=-
MSLVNEALEHTPTVVELYILKAQIFKHMGDLVSASTFYEEARKLDLADRYLSARSSRYLIRIDKLQEAVDTMMPFSHDGDNQLNVHDMQCMWYENEVGASYLRQGNYQMSLKNFNYIENHFDTINEDQLDFHLYSIRRFTVGAYFQMLEMEEQLYKSKYAKKCAIGTLKCLKKVSKLSEQAKKDF